jgi:hypothetical protein
MRKFIFLLICITGFAQGVHAQARLGISSTGLISLKDSVLLGTQLSVQLYVTNVGDESYSGPLAVNFRLGNISFYMKGKEDVSNFDPNDSHKLTFTIPFTTQTSGIGSNIIIAWPTGTNIKTRDTVYKKVVVQSASDVRSIHENILDRVSIFPNPANQFVYFKGAALLENIVNITLIDVTGRTYSAHLDTSRIDVSNLPNGLYYMRFVYADGRIASYKLMVLHQ